MNCGSLGTSKDNDITIHWSAGTASPRATKSSRYSLVHSSLNQKRGTLLAIYPASPLEVYILCRLAVG